MTAASGGGPTEPGDDEGGGPAQMPVAHRLGWALFLLSAALFTWSGIRAEDPVVVAGSLVFALASALFLLPPRG
ncbi:hypothetical protein PO878_12515 [Iamia majanohamensis]|uniref:Uncharacterized protein n=1 Tax=Iamia majanohamensis TaxID=467976 RepID=A0AAF0BUE5_9ACTN|nr:hypothetical protein [Iamia majanohamensis]WCO65319.1 hypothetical protein PO878_12515 [Iamia majanohamensis]